MLESRIDVSDLVQYAIGVLSDRDCRILIDELQKLLEADRSETTALESSRAVSRRVRVS